MSLRFVSLHVAAWCCAAFLLPTTAFGDAPDHVGTYTDYAVAADHDLASQAGAEILQAGGNAADAAAATMLALGVVNPQSSGLGGGGLAVYYDAESGDVTFLDFREAAPGGATADMFDDNDATEGPASRPSQLGGLASGVPGEPAGIEELVQRFGTKSLDEIVAPAVRLADDGFEVREALARMSQAFAVHLRRDAVMRRWLGDDEALTAGSLLRQPELARTLRLFGRRGARPFYRGAVAGAMVAASRRNGGILTREDLRDYRVIEREALQGDYFGLRWFTAPSPSAGGYAMLASLALLEQWIPLARRRTSGEELAHAFAESWKGPFWDRAAYFGDSDHVDIRLDQLTAVSRTAQRAEMYRPSLATPAHNYAFPLPEVNAAPASPARDNGTSHLCVVDAAGNVASVTTTVNLPFGARYTAAGIVMNDQMDDFASDVGEANAFGLPGGAPNLPAPGKRPISSMSPTIVLDENGPVLCVGGSGGSRIGTATQQVAYHALVRGVDAAAAVEHPRVHHQGMPNVLRIEETHTQPEAVVNALRARGHVIETQHHTGVVQMIRIQEGRLTAVSDPRKGGQPAGR